MDTYIHARIGKASAVFRRLRNVWDAAASALTQNYASTLQSSCLYYHLCRRKLDICGQEQAHAGCVQQAMSAKYPGHLVERSRQQRGTVTKKESRQSQSARTVDKRRRRFVGHVLRLQSLRPVSAAVQWTLEGGEKRRGTLKKTWQDTLCDDLQSMDVSWEEAKSVAGNRKEWRQLLGKCSNANRRT